MKLKYPLYLVRCTGVQIINKVLLLNLVLALLLYLFMPFYVAKSLSERVSNAVYCCINGVFRELR